MTKINLPPEPDRTFENLLIRVTHLERIILGLGDAGVFELVFSRTESAPDVSLPFPVTTPRRFRSLTLELDEAQADDEEGQVLLNGNPVAAVTVQAGFTRRTVPVSINVTPDHSVRMSLGVAGTLKLEWAP